MIDLKSALDYLLANDYLVVMENRLTITNKLHREFRPVPAEQVRAVPGSTVPLTTREDIWRQFIKDACIPHQSEGTDGRKYTIRQYSPGIADKLIKIIKSVDYKLLVESTKRYYNSPTFKLILSNYIDRGVWKDEYERYQEGLKTNSLAYGQGGNAWET